MIKSKRKEIYGITSPHAPPKDRNKKTKKKGKEEEVAYELLADSNTMVGVLSRRYNHFRTERIVLIHIHEYYETHKHRYRDVDRTEYIQTIYACDCGAGKRERVLI